MPGYVSTILAVAAYAFLLFCIIAIERERVLDYWKTKDQKPKWFETLKKIQNDPEFAKKMSQRVRRTISYTIFTVGFGLYTIAAKFYEFSERIGFIIGAAGVFICILILLWTASVGIKRLVVAQIENFEAASLYRKLFWLITNLGLVAFVIALVLTG